MQCTYVDLLIHQPLSKTKHVRLKLRYKLERNEYVKINYLATLKKTKVTLLSFDNNYWECIHRIDVHGMSIRM